MFMSKCALLAALLIPLGLIDLTDPDRIASDSPAPLKVFLLAGQSNMEGKGAVNTLDYLGEDPRHGHLLDGLKEEDGSWTVREDVWIWFLGRKGELTVGFGSEGSSHGPLIGPELGFGMVVGDRIENQVLLIKTAWGGKDVASDFLPPGAGGPGPYYTRMLNHVREVLGDLEAHFPDYDGRGFELAGFVWFQGWNDMVNGEKTAAYAERLAQMIRDLRGELDAPDLPVVIGELGVGGDEPSAGVARFREAHEAVALVPELEDTVRFVRTAPFYDPVADELFRHDVWKGPDKDRFYRIASDRPYHYLGSGKTYYLMGRAFGEGMLELLEGE